MAQTDLFRYRVANTIAIAGKPTSIAFSSDGSKAFVGAADGVVTALSVPEGGSQLLINARSSVSSVACNRPGSLVAAGSADGLVRLSSSTGVRELKAHRGRVTSLTFSPGGEFLASAAEDRAVVIWDAASGRELFRLDNPSKKTIKRLGFTGGGTSLVGVADNGAILEWDVKTRAILRQLQDSDGSVLSAGISFGGSMLALGTEFTTLNKFGLAREANPTDLYRDNRIKLYSLEGGAVAKQITGIDGEVMRISLSADNRFAAAVRQRAKETFISVYDLQRGVEIASLPSAQSSTIADFSPDGGWLASLTVDGKLQMLAVEGVQRGTDVGDLRGNQITITSKDKGPLIKLPVKTVMAVMDFDGLGVDIDTGRAVAEMLRNRIAGSPNVELVARNRMQEIIKEQNFQYSDRADALTAVQLGRVLNTRKMIFGSVSKLGSAYTISVQVMDTETARVDGVREVLCQKCALDDLPLAIATLKTALIASEN